MAEPTRTTPWRHAWRLPWRLPPVWFLPFNALLVLLDRLCPIVQLLDQPVSYVGWLPILTGTSICLIAAGQFRAHRTTIRPFCANSALITTGLFRFSRNPIYLGMVLSMLGVAINAGSFSALLVPPLFAIALQLGFIRPEERALQQYFGPIYDRYCQQVHRWL